MRLLVSVRDAGEATDAVAGGADIVDAKEPTLGPLAPVSPEELQAISAAVPPELPLSVALGDALPEELDDIVAAVGSLPRRGALYFKAALVSRSARHAAPAIAAAVGRLAMRPDRPALVVARYVDAAADATDLGAWVDVCAASGAHGLLLDTSWKAGATLFASVGVRALSALRRRAARQGIWLALAGGMTINDLERVGKIRPHVLGVRGAVCDGPRTGALSRRRVEHVREALNGVRARLQPLASPA